MTMTRRDLVRSIADKLEDALVCVATTNGSVTTFIDSENLTDADNAYRGSFAILTAGTVLNLGETRRVESSSQSSTTLTFNTSLPAATAAGDEITLVNLHGVGFKPQVYFRVINDAIAMLSDGEYMLTTTVEADADFDDDDPQVTVPSELEWIHLVEYSDGDGEWYAIPEARFSGFSSSGYSILGLTGQIEIQGIWRSRADGYAIRFRGSGPPQPMASDSDPCPVPAEFVIFWAAHTLAMRRGGQKWSPTGMLYLQHAMAARPKASLPWPPNSRRVR